jgi:muramoyltetrapeptide carboxypeptidase
VNKWQALSRGDVIDIIAPASAGINPPLINQQAADFIKELGFTPRLPADMCYSTKQLLEKGLDPFCSNSDEYRFNHLKQALYAEDSKVIWCTRGGYGSMRIIPQLAELIPPENAKLIIGFSDITALMLFFTEKWHWPVLHAKVLTQYCGEQRHEQSVSEIKEVLYGKKQVTYHKLIPLNELAKSQKIIEGQVIGGNLCLIETSLSTNWQINADDKILLLEEVGERGYRIDRSLEHLKQAGVFDKVKAIIFGAFIGGDEADGSNYVQHAINRFIAELKIPAISYEGFGHGIINQPLPMGTICKLSLGEEISFTCDLGSS